MEGRVKGKVVLLKIFTPASKYAHKLGYEKKFLIISLISGGDLIIHVHNRNLQSFFDFDGDFMKRVEKRGKFLGEAEILKELFNAAFEYAKSETVLNVFKEYFEEQISIKD